MRALLVSPLGLLIGLSLGALGGGGSIMAVPALVYAAGQTPRAATTTSLLLVGVAALVGMTTHWRAGRVNVRTGILFGMCGIGGSLAGSALNRYINPDILLLGFAALTCVAASRMLNLGESAEIHVHPGTGLTPATSALRTTIDNRAIFSVLAAGSVVGFLTGLFGVGGGFVIVPALTLALKLPMPTAIGTSLLVIAINSAVALSTRIATASVEWTVTLPFVIAAIAGVLLGGRIAERLEPCRSLRWFAVALIAVATYTACSAASALLS
jgi:uncharacterized protein